MEIRQLSVSVSLSSSLLWTWQLNFSDCSTVVCRSDSWEIYPATHSHSFLTDNIGKAFNNRERFRSSQLKGQAGSGLVIEEWSVELWEKIEIERLECEEPSTGVLSYLGEATGDLIKLPGLSSIALHSTTTPHGGQITQAGSGHS